MHADQKFDRPQCRGKHGGARRLIAGLRITHQDEAILAIVRPFFPEADSEGELAYRLWRRGLEVTLAEAVGSGAALPTEITEEGLAALVAQRLLLCLPLLRRTGTLSLLGLDAGHQERLLTAESHRPLNSTAPDTIDLRAAEVIAALGGNDFL